MGLSQRRARIIANCKQDKFVRNTKKKTTTTTTTRTKIYIPGKENNKVSKSLVKTIAYFIFMNQLKEPEHTVPFRTVHL